MYQVSHKVCEEYKQKFGENISAKNEDRLRFILSHQIIRRKLDEWVAHPNLDEVSPTCNSSEPLLIKNSERSFQKKEEGNIFFQKKVYRQSLMCYNEALRLTKFSTSKLGENENIALLFGNRSAAYYELGTSKSLQNSMVDINLAFSYGYPDRLKVKLLLRRANIYLKLGKVDQAYNFLHEAGKCETISAAERIKLNSIKSEIEDISKKENIKYTVQENEDLQSDVLNLSGFKENLMFEGASAHLALQYSQNKTRYVKCTANLTFGDILFYENPFTSILIPEFYESHCFHCHRTLQNDYFFPCSQCSQIKFCLESCYFIAWESYHKYECCFLSILNSVGIAHLALKCVLVAGRTEALKIIEICRDNTQITSDARIFKKGELPYCRIFSLLDHIDEIPGEDLFQYSLTAGLLLNHLLKNTTFLDGASDADIFKIGGILLKHICQLICNAHAITYIASDFDVPVVSSVTTQEHQVRIASAIYPSASMMNHSCEPCIAPTFTQGRQLVVRVTADLKKGSEVFNCYGPHARRMRREARQEALAQQYFFKCDCSFCNIEAEQGYSFVDKFQALKCSTCAGPVIPDPVKKSILVECQDCGAFENIETKIRSALRVDKLITLGTDLVDKGKVPDALTALLEGYKLCKQNLYRFHADFGHICDLLGRCYATVENFDEAARYVKESVNYIHERFGEFSVEYARGLSTLEELLSLSYASESEHSWVKLAMEKSQKVLQLHIHS